MADKIQLKRSIIPGLKPSASELEDGELSVNTFDALLYCKDEQGQVVTLNPPAPIQSISSSSSALTVSASGTDVTLGLSIEPTPQEQADWAETDSASVSFIKSKPTALSEFTNDTGFVNSAAAAAAAPVQGIAQGAGATIVEQGGVYTISVSFSPASTSSDGVVRLASSQDIIDKTVGAVVDAAQLGAAIPTKVSQLSNDSSYATTSQLVSYLPLAGGTVAGALRAPTPPQADSSTLVATTEWVRREIDSAGEFYGAWQYGGSDATQDPGLGYLRLSADGQFLAINKYAYGGVLSIPAGLKQGDVIELRDAPAPIARVAPAILTEVGTVITTESGDPILTEG